MVTSHHAVKLQRFLPETIEYFGEFGPEIVLFIPFLRFCNSIGALYGKRIVTFAGMECFYEAAGLRLFDIKSSKRIYKDASVNLPWLPLGSEHHYNHIAKSMSFDHPNYRKYFSDMGILPGWPQGFDRPIALVYNKITNEWNKGPVNFYSLEELESIFNILSNIYQVVYVQHDLQQPNSSQYAGDHNEEGRPAWRSQIDETRQKYRDYLTQRSDVILFQSILESVQKADPTISYNLVNCSLISQSNLFVTVQGGGSHLLAAFGDADMYLLHRKGQERESGIYQSGYYTFMADKPPRLFVANDPMLIIRKLANSDTVNFSPTG